VTAFSNGTEWDIWEGHWCSRCKVDEAWRKHETGSGCVLIMNAMTGDTPVEWTAPDPERPHNYECQNFKPIKEPE
jgi:hypothetical protein